MWLSRDIVTSQVMEMSFYSPIAFPSGDSMGQRYPIWLLSTYLVCMLVAPCFIAFWLEILRINRCLEMIDP